MTERKVRNRDWYKKKMLKMKTEEVEWKYGQMGQ